MAHNTVAFPTVSTPSLVSPQSSPAQPEHLVLSRHATALEICDLVYSASPRSWDMLEKFYDTNAVYENPFLTANSRAIIADIHSVASHLTELDVPRPVAVLHALFGMKRDALLMNPWFHAIKIWSEIGDVCESESFDGHKKAIVEHTLNIMLLPGLHRSDKQPSTRAAAHASTDGRSLSFPVSSLQHVATNSTLGMDLSLPSPFHLRLPIISRLYFNDAGKITHHRDFWDVKDLLGLLPGMSLAQWISGRLVAQGIRGVLWFTRSLFTTSSSIQRTVDEEAAVSSKDFAQSIRDRRQDEGVTLRQEA